MSPLIVDTRPVAALVLADGTVFRGRSIGAPGETLGEVVFNTAMTGYQEILTDPSYAGQLVTLTYPHIGNTGVNDDDEEAVRVFAAGLIARDVPQRASNFRMGYALVATRGTAQAIEQAGIPVKPVNKVKDGRPHVVDLLKNGDIQLVITTVSEVRSQIADSRSIRTTALAQRVTYYTTIAGGRAAIEGMGERL